MTEFKMQISANPSSGVRYAKKGMVASSSTLAAAAGVSVLQRGGNAFDAAIAVAGVEWIDLAAQCGLGGDVFAVCYDAKEDRVVAINGSGESARAASRAQARRDFFEIVVYILINKTLTGTSRQSLRIRRFICKKIFGLANFARSLVPL